MMIISGVGRLGADPKMSFTPKATAQTLMNLAVECGFGDKKQTVWVSVISWGTEAELLNNSLSKGQRLFFSAEVTGLRTYEKKDQTTGVTLDAKLKTFQFLDAPHEPNEPEVF